MRRRSRQRHVIFVLSVKRGLAAGGAVLLLGGAAVGAASAQTAPATPAPQSGQTQPGYQAFVEALARRLGVTTSVLQTAISQARTDAGFPRTAGSVLADPAAPAACAGWT
jgi:hypothetical protein